MIAQSCLSFNRVTLLCIISAHAIVTLYLPLCVFLNASCGVSLSLCACIVASHLGTLDARRVELKDKVGAEPEDGDWWTHLEDGRMDPDVHDQRRTLAERLSSN